MADEKDAADRLEAALDRIAQCVRARPAPAAAPDQAELAARLDQLIARLRLALDDAET